MRIKKVYINNFKGIKDKKIIDFDTNSSFLIGPNGFGKTTIFDVLELCLTNKIQRTIEKSHVTSHRSNYKKPFYQNTENKDVIIKVWLEKQNEKKQENLIITKYLPSDHVGRSEENLRKNRPDDFKLLQTYKDTIENFDSDTFIPEKRMKLTQNDINDFFSFESNDLKIDEIYNLFNYLQQEDTTFFLKQSENERKASLSFLFNTTELEDEHRKLVNLHSKLNGIYRKLEYKITEIHTSTSSEQNELKYHQLFPYKSISFDRELLYSENSLHNNREHKDNYIDDVNKLIDFMNEFSPQEYSKKQTVELIQQYKNNSDFINHYILQSLLNNNNYQKIRSEWDLIKNDKKIKTYILQKIINNYEQLRINRELYLEYTEFLNLNEFKTQIDKITPFVEKLIPEKSDMFLNLLDSREVNLNVSKEIDILIKEIIRLRNELRDTFITHQTNEKHDSSCPYCGMSWDTFDNLDDNFKQRETSLKDQASSQSKALLDIELTITASFINPIKEIMKMALEKIYLIDADLLEALKDMQDESFDFKSLNNFDLKTFIWNEPKTHSDLINDLEKIKTHLQEKASVSNNLFLEMNKLYHQSYSKDVDVLESMISKEKLNPFIVTPTEHQTTMSNLQTKAIELTAFLEKCKSDFKYIPEKSADPHNLYARYFDSKEVNFLKLKKDDLIKKKYFIESSFSIIQDNLIARYEKRSEKLLNIINNVDRIKDLYNKNIVAHKKDMADNIKLPFYIYSAKILQNFQQGMGVFLDTKERNESIRFLTDSSTNHDAMHHLSSGQLAVISLAFTLAVNKTYNISPNLKFLTIDDPIQEMDTLNIHSFTELIRHEFLDEYQLIFSTHNDLNALYMKYKFDKVSDNNTNMINVQSKFFNY